MSISNGPKINVMVSAANGDTYGDSARQQFRMFQTLIMANVKNMSLATPPGSPSNGDTYVVASGGTGAWASQDNNIAYWTTDDPNTPSGKWEFYAPQEGWEVYNTATGVKRPFRFNGTAWVLANIALRKVINTSATGATTLDASQGNAFAFTLTGNITLTITNPSDGQEITILFKQDATGSRSVTWPANVKGNMTVSGTANSVSQQKFAYDLASTNWYAVNLGVTGM
jgi:hypothetical protein